MLTVFDRYLLRTVLMMTCIALIFLLAIDFIIQTSSDADEIGNGHFTLPLLLFKHLLSIPDKIIVFAPAAILIGTMTGLGQLNTQHELTVIRAIGIARIRIAYPAILLAFFIGLGNLANSEWLAPLLNAQSRLIYDRVLGRSSDLTTGEGIWLQQEENMIHIAGLNPDGSLHGLRFFRITANRIEITEAENARYQGKYWQLSNVRRYRTTDTETKEIPAAPRWDTDVSPQTLRYFAAIHRADTVSELLTLIRFMQANRLNHRHESLQLWQHLFTPLTTIVMVLLALPFAFGHTRNIRQGTRLVIGILLGVSYYMINGIITNLTLLLGWSPLLGAALPLILFTLPALILLQRQ